MPTKFLPIDQLLINLATTPSRLAALTASLTSEQLRASPPGEWSANEVLAHLRACADVWGGYILEMIAQDHPTLRAVNPRTWIKQTDYLEQEFQPSLQVFTAQRLALLAVLEPLAPEGWIRAATVTGAGQPREKTVLSYAQRLALHESPHIKQIERIVKVLGPSWKKP